MTWSFLILVYVTIMHLPALFGRPVLHRGLSSPRKKSGNKFVHPLYSETLNIQKPQTSGHFFRAGRRGWSQWFVWPTVSNSVYLCFFHRWTRTPNTITALIQQDYMKLSQTVTSRVCTSPKNPIFPKNGPSCISGRCGHTGWKAEEAIPPLTTQLHLVLASEMPHVHWFGSMLCCVYVLRTTVRVSTAPGMYLTTRLLPPQKTDISSPLRLSIIHSMSRMCTRLLYRAYFSSQI